MGERKWWRTLNFYLIEGKHEAGLIKTISPWELIKLSNSALNGTHGMIF